ncbi:MAG TPA: mechanosensitive ion channel family protein [Verrucomicrobiae bacterium]|nr:mechanosensitive ion channel family protein [Verrucomicrobiae bacterium]
MSDLIAAIKGFVSDPLVVAVFLLILGAVSARVLFKSNTMGRALTRLVFFSLLTLVLLRAGVVPYEPLRPASSALRGVVSAGLKIAWWAWGAWLLVGFLRTSLNFERRPREAKLLQDIIAGVIYLAAAFAIIAYVFDLPIQGLLATSGAIAIIIGLALQSSLGDVFSGLVLSFSRPYRPDDWVRIDSGTEGRVIEMNWRATHILTAQHDLAIMPNSVIAKTKIVNLSSPSSVHGVTVSVQVAATTLPATGVGITEHAILNSRLILTYPKASVVVKAINADIITYEVTFFVADLGSATAAQNDLLDLIFRHFSAAHVEFARSDGTVSPGGSDAEPASDSQRVLAQSTIFADLTPEERAALANKLQRKLYEPGEALLEPGVVLSSLFLIGSGVLSVTHPEAKKWVEILRLGPGDHFGEIALLTGEGAWGRITALTPTVVYELPKKDLAPILEARPQVAHELSRALAQRQAAGRMVSSAERGTSEPTANASRWFTERLQKLFNLRSE